MNERRADYPLATARGCLVGLGLSALLYAAVGILFFLLLVVAERVWGVRLRW